MAWARPTLGRCSACAWRATCRDGSCRFACSIPVPSTRSWRELADEAGLDLTDVEDHDPFPLGGAEVKGLPKIVDCVIEDGTGAAITLKDIKVVFTSPWTHSFGAILGTIAMRQIHVIVSAAEEWIEISEA